MLAVYKQLRERHVIALMSDPAAILFRAAFLLRAMDNGAAEGTEALVRAAENFISSVRAICPVLSIIYYTMIILVLLWKDIVPF